MSLNFNLNYMSMFFFEWKFPLTFMTGNIMLNFALVILPLNLNVHPRTSQPSQIAKYLGPIWDLSGRIWDAIWAPAVMHIWGPFGSHIAHMGPIYRLHPGPQMGTIWAMLVFTSGSYVGPTWYQDGVFIWVLYGPHMVSILSFFLGPIWAPPGFKIVFLSGSYMGPTWYQCPLSIWSNMGPTWYQDQIFIWAPYGPHM